jgi:subtilisin family serine protease
MGPVKNRRACCLGCDHRIANRRFAIVDSGIDLSHPDLAGKLWVNPGEIAGNGIDDDNNGFIDDVNGWDFVNDDNNP